MKSVLLVLVLVLFSLVLAAVHRPVRVSARVHLHAPSQAHPLHAHPLHAHPLHAHRVRDADTATSSDALAALSIDFASPRANESHNMWGLFFEEIFHSGVAGLYSQQLNNSNFEVADILFEPYTTTDTQAHGRTSFYEPWFLLPPPAGLDAWIGVNQDVPLNGWNSHSLHVRSAGAAGNVTLVNPGFWGINTIGVTSYTVSFYATARTGVAAPTQFTVSIYSNTTGAIYASITIAASLASTSWQKFTATFPMSARSPNDSAAYFSISWPTAPTGGTTLVYFDLITLFPDAGWNGLPYIRPDIGQILADLHPAFVRFPGGCYVEGTVLGNRFNWKNTIGPVENRRGHWGIWGYYSEDHLGIFEYFSFVEKLTDAYGNPTRAYWVINSGNAHFQQLPPDQLGEFVQDALDSIEFIMGPSTSFYGSIRAAMGHPEPFTSLTHISIGNEGNLLADWQNVYPPNYAVFYKALKAAYPQLTYIANANLEPFQLTTELWDYHIYDSSTYFLNNSDYFDAASRSQPPIFNSEYAATNNGGTALTALSEAAWMTGLQRNADLVTSASYSPLMANTNQPGLQHLSIVFDSYRTFGTPSYWTQWLFSNANQGTLSGTVQVLDYTLDAPVVPAGAVPALFSVVTYAQLNATEATQHKATNVLIVKVVNANATSVTIAIDVGNVPTNVAFLPVADVWTLAASSPSEQNTYEQPDTIVPVSSALSVPGASFAYTFVPWSTTVIRAYVMESN